MPVVSDDFGPYPVSVVLNGSGYGFVIFQATGTNLLVSNLYVACSSVTAQASCVAYKNNIGAQYRVASTNSGSTGANAGGAFKLKDGEKCIVEWTGGTPGATATATFSGNKIPFDQTSGGSTLEFEDPIAAGDGSLIYPAIKSPNFLTGVSGWNLDRDGNVEFNNGVFRGTLVAGGGTVTVTASGLHISAPPVTVDITSAGMVIDNGTTRVETTETALVVTDLATNQTTVVDSLGLSSDDPTSDLSSAITQGFINLSDGFNQVSTTLGPGNGQFDGEPIPSAQRGQALITAAAANQATVNVVFPTSFATYNDPPTVLANIATTPGAAGAIPRRWNLRTINTTYVGFTVIVYSDDASTATFTNQVIEWTAFGGAL